MRAELPGLCRIDTARLVPASVALEELDVSPFSNHAEERLEPILPRISRGLVERRAALTYRCRRPARSVSLARVR